MMISIVASIHWIQGMVNMIWMEDGEKEAMYLLEKSNMLKDNQHDPE